MATRAMKSKIMNCNAIALSEQLSSSQKSQGSVDYLYVLLLVVLRLCLLPLNHLLLVLVLLLRLSAARSVLCRVRAEHEPGGDAVAERGEVAVLRRYELCHVHSGGRDLFVRGRQDGHRLRLHLHVMVSSSKKKNVA